MTELSNDDRKPECRPIPLWGWILGALFFPPGIFIVLAASRALRWWIGLLLALVSYVGMVTFVVILALSPNDSSLARVGNLTALLLYYIAVGQMQYVIGARAGLWRARGRRMWRFFAGVALFLFFLSVVEVWLKAVVIL